MAILTGPNALNQLLARHQSRFRSVLGYAESQMVEAVHDMFAETVDQFSGPPSQPSGDSRRLWERDTRPFAKYFFDKPNHVPADPNPVGVITGDLLYSLGNMMTSSGTVFTAYTYSTSPYAVFLLAPQGTEYMVPRGVSQHMQEWSIMRMTAIGLDIMDYQRSLI